jgi:SAM-dependent methyltransferase
MADEKKPFPDWARRVYYDHEGTYRGIAQRGGDGWEGSSLVHLQSFLRSPHMPPVLPGAVSDRPRVLDLGCGGGQAGFELVALGFQLTGIDYSETAIELARANAARLGITAEFIRGDCTDVDIVAESSFDLVLDSSVLHCLVEPEHRRRFLQLAFRALRPGGTFFSATMSAEGPLDYQGFGIDPETRIHVNRTRFWVKRHELEEELRNAGFVIVEMRQASTGPDDPIVDLITVARRPLLE